MFLFIFLAITMEEPRGQDAGCQVGVAGDHSRPMAWSMKGEAGRELSAWSTCHITSTKQTSCAREQTHDSAQKSGNLEILEEG